MSTINALARTSAHLGSIIQRARKQRHMTQAALGEKAGLRQATISKMEGGEDARLANVLSVLAALDLELVVRDRTKADDREIEELF
jgi:HTH-type transcriptional regulator/antitoxin HipB